MWLSQMRCPSRLEGHLESLSCGEIKPKNGIRTVLVPEMKKVLHEEWDRITIEEINKEIAQLPTTIFRCLAVKGGNNYHS